MKKKAEFLRIRLFIFRNEIKIVVKFTNFRFLLVYTQAVVSGFDEINCVAR
jgi:hypothetical protein